MDPDKSDYDEAVVARDTHKPKQREKRSRVKPRISIEERRELNRISNVKYFEGTVQLRGFTKDEIEEIYNQIGAAQVRIAKIIHHPKGGTDIVVSSQRFIQRLERWVKNRFVCETKLSNTLHTRDNQANKDLYRLTLLVTMIRHRIGDIIIYNDEQVKISTIGKKPVGKIISNGKRIFLDSKILANMYNQEKNNMVSEH